MTDRVLLPTSAVDKSLARPDRRRWGQAALLGGLLAANNLDRGNLTVALPLIMNELHLTNTQGGFILSAFQWTYALANLPMGFLADRLDTKRLVTMAAIAWTCFAAATSLTHGILALLLLRAGLGVAEAPMFPAAIKIVGTWFPDRERAAAVSLYEIAAQIGFAAAPPLATWLMLLCGWRTMFVLIALATLLPLALWLRFYQVPPPESRLSGTKGAIEPADWLRLLRHPQPWIMFAGSCCLAGGMGFFNWLPIYLEKTYGFSLAQAGGATGMTGAAGLVGILLGGLSSDRLIRGGMAPLAARRLSIVLPALLMAMALIGIAVFQAPAIGMSLIVFSMFLAGLGIPAWWALATLVAPSARFLSSVGSIQNAGAFLGAAAGPIAIGMIIDRTGSFTTILFLAAGLTLAMAAFYGLALRRPIPAEDADEPAFSDLEVNCRPS